MRNATLSNAASRRLAATFRALLLGVVLAGTAGTTTAAMADTESVRCVQKQLRRLGFDVGLIDGLMGVRTFLAGEAYIRYMQTNSEARFSQPSLNDRNARHWCETIAGAHPEVASFWRAILNARPRLADPEAIFRLAHQFDAGQGVRKDEALAVKWYRRAAELGYAPAQRNLGGMYGAGRGVAEDQVLARYWFLAAANQDDAQAQFVIGKQYSSSEKAALGWLWRAARQGHAQAIAELEHRFGI